MTRSITHKGVELLGWPSESCKDCHFCKTGTSCLTGTQDELICITPDDQENIIWLAKEEWLKRRIKE